MKQYTIDELRFADYETLKKYLDENFSDSSFDSVYWIPLIPDILNPVQKEHIDCQPFYFAAELFEDRLVCELLLRTKNRLRCECIGYADRKQLNWIIDSVDSIFERLEIII